MKFLRDLAHLLLVFPPEAGEQNSAFPKQLSPGLMLTHDALGSMRHSVKSIYDLLGAADSQTIEQAVRPAWNKLWYIHHLAGWTDDGTPRQLYFSVHEAAGGYSISVANWASVANRWQPYTGNRIILSPLNWLSLASETALSAGKKLRMTFMYVEVPIGEHVPRE